MAQVSQVFFVDASGTLWSTDGTAAGTVPVAPIDLTGTAFQPIEMFVDNGLLFFTGIQSADGFQLWKSDGTSSGTTMLTDLNPANGGVFSNDFTDLSGTLYFSADDGTHGFQLWRSDGTAAGTVMCAARPAHPSRPYPANERRKLQAQSE